MAADWTRVRELFEQAVELGPAERQAYLRSACGADAELAREVEDLLAADAGEEQGSRSGSALLTPAGVADFVKQGASSSLAGATVGSFRLVRALGSGGMGTVYEAVQDRPRRTVAVKVLNLGWLEPDRLRRFEIEAETLGRLRHPAIAQIHESGVADLGDAGLRVPYFAMELVEGARTLLAFAEAEGLGLDARLELFLTVADAVQHAHRCGVIHRDLKPGNLLVDASGRPKVIDFGIARTVRGGEGGDEGQDLTRTGVVLGTLGSMAPEQLDGALEVDTRVDVYGLGAVLYQLVTTRPPLDLSGCALPEAARIVKEVQPRPPSGMVPQLPRELDWVLARALEKERELRYPSVAALAEDVRRLRDHEPVEAGPPSAAYRVRKFVRRNRVMVAALTAVFVALTVGLGFTSWGLVRATRAEADARTQFAQAASRADELEVLNEFLLDFLTSPAASAWGHDVRVVDVLDEARASLDEGFEGRPSVELAQRLTLSDAYAVVGNWADSLSEAERCLPLLEQLEAPDPQRRGEVRVNQVYALIELDRAGEAAALAAAVRAEPWLEATDVGPALQLLHGRALFANGRTAAGERELRALAALADGEQGLSHELVATLHTTLSDLLRGSERLTEALEHARLSLELRRAASGVGAPSTLLAESEVAVLESLRGAPERAVERLEGLLAKHAERYGAAHPWILRVRTNLAGVLVAAGRLGDALRALEANLLVAREAHGEASAHVLELEWTLGSLSYDHGLLEAAEQHYRTGLSGARRYYGEGDPETLRFVHGLVVVLGELGRPEEAAALLEELHVVAAETLGPESLAALEYRAELGIHLHHGRHLDEAAPHYRAVLAGVDPSTARGAFLARRTSNDLGYLLHAQGRREEARELYGRALELGARTVGEFDPSVLSTLMNLALLEHQAGDPAAGDARLAAAVERARAEHGPRSPELATCVETYVYYLDELGRGAEALDVYAASLPARPEGGDEPLHVADLRYRWAEALAAEGLTQPAAEQLASAAAAHRALRGPETGSTRFLERRLAALAGEAATE